MKQSIVGKIGGLFVILLLISIVSSAYGRGMNEAIPQGPFGDPGWEWAVGGGGSSIDYGYAVAVDGSGNCYVTGKFDGTAVFGSIVLTSYGGWDVFVAEYRG